MLLFPTNKLISVPFKQALKYEVLVWHDGMRLGGPNTYTAEQISVVLIFITDTRKIFQLTILGSFYSRREPSKYFLRKCEIYPISALCAKLAPLHLQCHSKPISSERNHRLIASRCVCGGGLSEGETVRVMRRESGIRFTAALDGQTWICGNQLAARMINTCQLETIASSQCDIKWAAHSTLNQSDLFPFSWPGFYNYDGTLLTCYNVFLFSFITLLKPSGRSLPIQSTNVAVAKTRKQPAASSI